jgi:YjbR
MGEPTVPDEVLDELRSVCLGLPEAYEEQAWVGTRWRVRGQTFAHVLGIDAGWPPAYARAAATEGPCRVLMFRSSGPELDVLRNTGHPFFAPPWRQDEVGMILPDLADVDWQEIAELVTDSYCAQAPQKLASAVDRPT